MDGRTRFHRLRYHLAAGFVTKEDKVADYGCGTGYGSYILSEKANTVYAIDMEESNINAAREAEYSYNISYRCNNLEEIDLPDTDVSVAFESIEHLYDPKAFVDKLKQHTKRYIIVSVPLNQKLIEVDGKPEEEGDSTHHSVFTKASFMELFLDEKWKEFWYFQDGVTFIAIFYNNDSI